MRPEYTTVLAELDLLRRLSAFDPVVIGTPPLDLATEASDIDVACSHCDLSEFGRLVDIELGTLPGFVLEPVDGLDAPAVRAEFAYSGWRIELFCQTMPTAAQRGVRHFLVERRLLGLEPRLRAVVMRYRRAGVKTEPAFARALNLSGDAYEAVLALERLTDAELAAVASRAVAAADGG